MNTAEFLTSTWSWNPGWLAVCAAAIAVYVAVFGWRARIWYLIAAVAVLLLTLCSPLRALADGYLFSAHMIEHIVLLLGVPALGLASLPRSVQLWRPLRMAMNPVVGWLCGVGAMWFWHVPALCNAAASSRTVSAVQTVTLIAMGAAFWWQVFAPREQDRLPPLSGVVYLFAACLACTVLGIILTFSPVTVCSAYVHPIDRLGLLSTLRNDWGMTPQRDQQAGGLIMWVPMCLIYLSAIFIQLARWYAAGTVDPGMAEVAATAAGRK